MLGISQYIAASRKPAPSHQPRTAASRAPGAARMISIPGTSPHQPRNSRFSPGKARMGSPPAASAAHRAGRVSARHTAALRRAAMTSIVSPNRGRAPAGPDPVPGRY